MLKPIDRSSELCIWGAGLSGHTLARALAEEGWSCLLIDVVPAVVERINRGELPFDYLAALTSPPDARTAQRLRATLDPSEALTPAHAVHFVCVPTENSNGISPHCLQQVLARMTSARDAARPLYLIIESTVSPCWLDDLVYPAFSAQGWIRNVDYHIGCSPRRDVFNDPAFNVRTITKAFGGDSPEMALVLREIYGTICRDLHQAPDAKHAALVKIVENLFRHSAILLANRLTTAFPEYDLSEVLRIAATKWNMDLYHPTLGIGGYCVPLAKDYLAETATEEGAAWLSSIADGDREIAERALQAIFDAGDFKNVAILGLAYAPALKVHVRSPALWIVDYLARAGCCTRAHDPLYNKDEIERILGVAALDFPSGLAEADLILLLTPHSKYAEIPDLERNIKPGAWVVDNAGHWRNRKFPPGVRYVEIGSAGLLTGGRPTEKRNGDQILRSGRTLSVPTAQRKVDSRGPVSLPINRL